MDNSLALLLATILPGYVIVACVLFYLNVKARQQLILERKKLAEVKTIAKRHKRLYVINPERD